MKILICCDSELMLQVAGAALEISGHQPVLGQDPFALAPEAPTAQAALVDATKGRLAGALLRDRGFLGRVFLLGDGPPEERQALSDELHLDGILDLSPPEGLAHRLQLALGLRRKVLIVDDSEIVARLLAEDLTEKGFEVQLAPDVEKATSLIIKRATRPDLILLDINMPKVDGGQFCRFLKRNAMFRSIKVLFCTGADRATAERLVAECGADGYILKDEYLGKWVVDNSV